MKKIKDQTSFFDISRFENKVKDLLEIIFYINVVSFYPWIRIQAEPD